MFKGTASIELGAMVNGEFRRAGEAIPAQIVESNERGCALARSVVQIRAFSAAGWTAFVFGAARVSVTIDGEGEVPAVSIVQVTRIGG